MDQELGTTELDGATGLDDSLDTGTQDTSTTDTAAETPASQESFIDPSNLPDELKPHWKSMHGAFTKKMEEVKDIRSAYEQVSNFWQDDSYARQILQQRFPNLGTSPTPTPNQNETNGNGSGVPPRFVEAIKSSMSPEMQFLANDLAPGLWKAMKSELDETVNPILQRTEQETRVRQDSEFNQLQSELDHKHPGWQQHESDMTSLLQFLQSDKAQDRRWGNKLELLLNAVSGNGKAVSEAVSRINNAGKNRMTTGTNTTRQPVNAAERVLKPRSNRDAVANAMEDAEKELAGQGVKVW